MVIVVFGATGQVGKRIVAYALAKGHTVKAFGRNVTQFIDEDLASPEFEAIRGSVFEAGDVLAALQGADAVLSVLGGSFDGVDKTRSLGIKIIAAQMQQAGIKRIVALGGSGVLNAPDGGYLIEKPDYPAEYIAVGMEHLQAYLNLQNTLLDWTFVCPPTIDNAEKTEHYTVSDTVLPTPNNWHITAGDLADFMIKEVERPEHLHQRVGISAL